MLDADGALGHLACYRAMEEAVDIARTHGIGAVTIKRMSHMGAAGAYALWAAEQGHIGLLTANSDAAVRLHDGRDAFHGTSPIAIGAPAPGQRPWLMDMATSAVPFNRVLLYRSLGITLPAGVAVDETGRPTTNAEAARVLSRSAANRATRARRWPACRDLERAADRHGALHRTHAYVWADDRRPA